MYIPVYGIIIFKILCFKFIVRFPSLLFSFNIFWIVYGLLFAFLQTDTKLLCTSNVYTFDPPFSTIYIVVHTHIKLHDVEPHRATMPFLGHCGEETNSKQHTFTNTKNITTTKTSAVAQHGLHARIYGEARVCISGSVCLSDYIHHWLCGKAIRVRAATPRNLIRGVWGMRKAYNYQHMNSLGVHVFQWHSTFAVWHSDIVHFLTNCEFNYILFCCCYCCCDVCQRFMIVTEACKFV